jgi:DNA-binding HxlR family transcriptional regulator
MDVTASSDFAAARGPCAGIPPELVPFIRQVPDRVGDKWSVLVIAALTAGPLRYTDLHRDVPGISQRMLTLTLHRLHQDGLVTRTAYPDVPPRLDYALTPLSHGLLEIVMSLHRKERQTPPAWTLIPKSLH